MTPGSELITDTIVTPGNAGDASVATDLIDDLLTDQGNTDTATDTADTDTDTEDSEGGGEPRVYGDAAYGTGEFQQHLDDAGIVSGCRTQPPSAPGGMFTKARFAVNLDDDTVTCPNAITVSIRRNADGGGLASFGENRSSCPLRAQCTSATAGRTIRVSRFEAAHARARTHQAEPAWRDDYRATRPKVERKLAHLMHPRHGGRRARVRGRPKVDADVNLLAAAANLARLATLGLRATPTGWAVTT